MTGFAFIVHEYFDEIAESYSMICVEESDSHVRYENDRATLGVGWDRTRSYELGVRVKLKTPANNDLMSFDLWDILRFQDAPETSWVGALWVESEQNLREPMRELALLAKSYASRFLEGNLEAFASIAKFTGRSSSTGNYLGPHGV